jgi:hypothetical protein
LMYVCKRARRMERNRAWMETQLEREGPGVGHG